MAKSKTNDRLLEQYEALHWYALRIAPAREFVAQRLLKDRGIVTFLPVEIKHRHRSRYSKAAGKPKEPRAFTMFPGYLFAGFEPGVPLWFNLFTENNHVKSVVGDRGVPYRLPVAQIRRQIEMYADGLVRPQSERFMQSGKEFKAGDQVLVADGPFEGLSVKVESIKGGNAKMFVELFGSPQLVTIATDKLERS